MSTVGLIVNAMCAGVMLGGFYAATAIGVTITFGMLNIVNIAHPAFVLAGSYVVVLLNSRLGLDPFVAAALLAPVFFAIGAAVYRIYFVSFERRGGESLPGLVFFFGLLFLIEALLIAMFGVDLRSVSTPYTDTVWRLGAVSLPARLLLPFVVCILMLGALQLFLKKTFFGRMVMAVGQDAFALSLMGTNPTRVKQWALAIAIGTSAIAGAMLVVVQPVQPMLGREFIGMVFAVCVLGGMGSIRGSLIAAMILGIAETFTATFLGASWAPAASFGLLLLTLAFRPAGLFSK